MIHWKRLLALVAGVVLVFVAPAQAQTEQGGEPGKVIVSLYHVAPGKHLDFLKWMAARDEISKEAGLVATQWYTHTDGDSWDFVGIAPTTTDAQDKKTDELARKKGLKAGFAAALELRQLLSSHTDTFAIGPQSAADLVKSAGR